MRGGLFIYLWVATSLHCILVVYTIKVNKWLHSYKEQLWACSTVVGWPHKLAEPASDRVGLVGPFLRHLQVPLPLCICGAIHGGCIPQELT